jgi:hypothetical protein
MEGQAGWPERAKREKVFGSDFKWALVQWDLGRFLNNSRLFLWSTNKSRLGRWINSMVGLNLRNGEK